LRNKGNKFYQNVHGNVFRVKDNSKKKKKIMLMKKRRTASIRSASLTSTTAV